MRHLTAVQLENGWHYASTSKRGGHPLGYCRDHAPHPTEQEARECFARYERDHVRLDRRASNWGDCDVCGAASKNLADIEGNGYDLVRLCDEHLTTEHAIQALGLNVPAGDSWQS